MTEQKKKKRWIKSAVEDRGALHRHLGVAEGEKIPEEKLRDALKSKDPAIRKEANLAMTLKGFHKDKKEKQRPTAKGLMSKMYGKKSVE